MWIEFALYREVQALIGDVLLAWSDDEVLRLSVCYVGILGYFSKLHMEQELEWKRIILFVHQRISSCIIIFIDLL